MKIKESYYSGFDIEYQINIEIKLKFLLLSKCYIKQKMKSFYFLKNTLENIENTKNN